MKEETKKELREWLWILVLAAIAAAVILGVYWGWSELMYIRRELYP